MQHWTALESAQIPDKALTIGRGKSALKINLACVGVDIETTNDPETESAYMYIWQMGINGVAYYGRTWDEYHCAIAVLRSKLSGNIVIGIQNMGFEMSFLLPQLYQANAIAKLFAKAKHEPLEVVTNDGIIYRDTKALTNMSLKALAKAYCITQKLDGDLDYSVMRNSKTPLTDREMQYCENDVLILCEFMEYVHKVYTEQGRRIPLTSTGIVRRMVKDRLKGWDYKNAQNNVKRLFPRTARQYDFIMRYLFRGGFTHAQTAICGQIIADVWSDDLKSAYPAEMAHRLYPMTPFATIPPETALKTIKRGMAVIMLVEFYDITATGAHVLESRHKVLEAIGAEWENGRLYHADKLTVMITEIDYKIYKMMYSWKRMDVIKAKSAVKKFLPDYLLQPLFEVYTEKERVGKLVKADPENRDLQQLYQSTKGKLNSFYGMCVARLNLTSAEYNGEWIEVQNSTYEDEIAKSVLSPFWGIYITAYTRLTICTALVALGDEAYYSDTDSIKHRASREYFDVFNERMERINAAMCEEWDLDFDVFRKLGTFENEGKYDRFKTLGAKRYITENDNKVKCTVAGLPKSTFSEYAASVGNDTAFEEFAPSMTFEVSGKNAHKYNGETTAIIDGEEMHELGSCYIYSVSFRMTVETSFLLAISKRERIVK